MNYKPYIVLILSLLLVLTAGAQDSGPEKSKKKKQSYLTDKSHWAIEIPIWIPGFRGEFVYGDVDLEGEDGTDPIPENPIEDPGFGDGLKRLFKTGWNLNYFFLTSIKYSNRRFYTELDAFSGTVGASLKFRLNDQQLVDAKAHSDLVRLVAGYELFEHAIFKNKGRNELYAYGGMRLHNFKVKSDLDRIGRTLKIDPLWVEPIIGLENELLLDYWKFVLRADMGSFGIDDKFSYQLSFTTFYRINTLLSIKLGWNAWYINYNDRFKNEDLKLKVHLAGPGAALVFNF